MIKPLQRQMRTDNRNRWVACVLATIALFVVALLATEPEAVAAPSEPGAASSSRWSKQRAWHWYYAHRWMVGSNYIPSNAINQLQMWQAATFDPARIDEELGWAQGLGINTMRVFLDGLLWKQDPSGFKARIRKYLDIASRHHIKTIFVLFDSVWDPIQHLGPQHPPIPGVHNSGWVQSPGVVLDDPSQYPRLEAYVKGIVGAFANDPRVLAWDVWNEPDNPGGGDYAALEPKDKFKRVAELLPKVFAWVRSMKPSQPLTSAVWRGPSWAKSNFGKLNVIEQIQLTNSDVVSFHDYGWPEEFAKRVKELESYGRPIICTEYMARGNGSIIDTILPLGKKLDVGMINWGFVDGLTQTKYPWNSWQRPYVLEQPMVWFHDLLRPDGKPYRDREAQIIRALSKSPRTIVPAIALMPQGTPVSAPSNAH